MHTNALNVTEVTCADFISYISISTSDKGHLCTEDTSMHQHYYSGNTFLPPKIGQPLT